MIQILRAYSIPIAIVVGCGFIAGAHLIVYRYEFRTVTIGDNPWWAYEVKADRWTGRQCAVSGIQRVTIERGLPYCD